MNIEYQIGIIMENIKSLKGRTKKNIKIINIDNT